MKNKSRIQVQRDCQVRKLTPVRGILWREMTGNCIVWCGCPKCGGSHSWRLGEEITLPHILSQSSWSLLTYFQRLVVASGCCSLVSSKRTPFPGHIRLSGDWIWRWGSQPASLTGKERPGTHAGHWVGSLRSWFYSGLWFHNGHQHVTKSTMHFPCSFLVLVKY